MEHLVSSTGGWETNAVDLVAAVAPTDDMRLRFAAQDGSDDTAVEGAVDEVSIGGTWVNCQDHEPPAMLPPNPVGETLLLGSSPSGHVVLAWQAPTVDADHDAATLYRIERAPLPTGPFVEVGSATSTAWQDVDALLAGDSHHYKVFAENSGGSE